MIKVRSFETVGSLIQHSDFLLRETLQHEGNLMLSGGSTPYIIYNRLAATPCPVHPNRILFLSDERMQPADSTKNNAHNLEPMLKALQCDDRFIRVDTTQPIQRAAEKFATEVAAMERVDLGLLGMGTDGHTAGFFSAEQAAMKTGALTLHTERPDGMQGVSVTPAFFRRIEKIILLVTGESKRAIIHTLLNDPQSIPAGIALSDHPNTELWTDIQL